MEKLLEKQDKVPCQKKQVKEKDRCSLAPSAVELPEGLGGRCEESRDCDVGYRGQAGSSKTEKSSKADRPFSYRREAADAGYRNSEEKVKMHGYKRFEKDTEGKKEHWRRGEPGSTRYSTAPANPDCSWKSAEKYGKWNYPGSRDLGRYEQRHQVSKNQGESEKEENHEADVQTEPPDVSRKGQLDGGMKKTLPQNLLNIFNQIAAFEREKGNKPKN